MRGQRDGSAMRIIRILAAAALLATPSLASAEVVERLLAHQVGIECAKRLVGRRAQAQ